MRYINPSQVISPKDFIGDIQVIHDGGTGEEDGNTGFSLARINWEGNSVIGIRWNVARREWDTPSKIDDSIPAVGMPSSHGYPVWFIIPNELLNPESEIWNLIRENINDK